MTAERERLAALADAVKRGCQEIDRQQTEGNGRMVPSRMARLVLDEVERSDALPSPTDDQVEKVARAICAAGCSNGPSLPAWIDKNWSEYTDEARAAISAIGGRG